MLLSKAGLLGWWSKKLGELIPQQNNNLTGKNHFKNHSKCLDIVLRAYKK